MQIKRGLLLVLLLLLRSSFFVCRNTSPVRSRIELWRRVRAAGRWTQLDRRRGDDDDDDDNRDEARREAGDEVDHR